MAQRPRLRPRRDVGLALLLTGLALVSLPALRRMSEADLVVGPLAVVLVLAAGLPLTVRTWWPVPVLLVTAAATGAYLGLAIPYGPIMFCFFVAVYNLGRRVALAPAVGWALLALAAMQVHVFTNPEALPAPGGLVPASAWVVVPFTIGVARRMVLEAKERERAETERRLVDAERLRVAQEVHDVVGHGLAAIQMQADIGLHVSERRPEQATQALAAISRASDEALTELRATLAAIAPDEQAARVPTAGLANLEGLRDRVQAAGVPVELRVEGTPWTLPGAVDLTAYRVLQEALTNVLKHAPRSRAMMTIAYHPDRVELRVVNEPTDAASFAEGFGIAGMRRRVEQHGGSLTAGPETTDAKGPVFSVRATLPAEKEAADG